MTYGWAQGAESRLRGFEPSGRRPISRTVGSLTGNGYGRGLARRPGDVLGWYDSRHLRRITAENGLLDPAQDLQGRQAWGGVMWDGENWVVVFWEGARLAMRRVSTAGAPVGGRVFLDGNMVNSPHLNALEVAWAGDRFAIAFYEHGTARVKVGVWSAAGVRLGPLTSFGGVNNFRPGLVWTGREFPVSYDQSQAGGLRRVVIARYDPIGNRVGGLHQVNVDGGYAFAPSLAWAGDRLGIVWGDTVGGGVQTWFVSGRYDCP